MTECLAIVITQKTQVKSELLLLSTGQNDESELFYDTWNCLEVKIPSSHMSIFVLYPKTITWIFTFAYGAMLGSENSELSSFALY